MSFDLTRGEIMLIAFILALVYSSGLLPRIAKALSPAPPADATENEEASKGE